MAILGEINVEKCQNYNKTPLGTASEPGQKNLSKITYFVEKIAQYKSQKILIHTKLVKLLQLAGSLVCHILMHFNNR